jgi:hypothetical protein
MSYDKPFTKSCDTCGQKIGFTKKDGRTVPVNADGSVHHCQPKPAAPKEDRRNREGLRYVRYAIRIIRRKFPVEGVQ